MLTILHSDGSPHNELPHPKSQQHSGGTPQVTSSSLQGPHPYCFLSWKTLLLFSWPSPIITSSGKHSLTFQYKQNSSIINFHHNLTLLFCSDNTAWIYLWNYLLNICVTPSRSQISQGWDISFRATPQYQQNSRYTVSCWINIGQKNKILTFQKHIHTHILINIYSLTTNLFLSLSSHNNQTFSNCIQYISSSSAPSTPDLMPPCSAVLLTEEWAWYV